MSLYKIFSLFVVVQNLPKLLCFLEYYFNPSFTTACAVARSVLLLCKRQAFSNGSTTTKAAAIATENIAVHFEKLKYFRPNDAFHF